MPTKRTTKNPFDLTGKSAIVTGGASGIGAAIVRCLAQQGADVLIADLNADLARCTAEQLSRLFKRRAIRYTRTDVTSDVSVEEMARTALKLFGKIDILVNDAGISGRPAGPLGWQELEDWHKIFEVNVFGIVRTVEAVAPHMVERKSGRIINISSIAGFMPGPMKPGYSTSKSAVAVFTMIVAKKLASYGVTANAIGPGILFTPLWQNLAHQLKDVYPELADKPDRKIFEEHMRKITPMQREQTPEEIGLAVVYLASEAARNVTGQIWFVDGGTVMRP